AARDAHPEVDIVRLGRNAGSAGRTVGARLSMAPYVAFADDDSWWAPGSLSEAGDLFDHAPGLGVLVARLLVGPEERLDQVCAQLARSPLGPCSAAPAVAVVGFPACAVVVRRQAFL